MDDTVSNSGLGMAMMLPWTILFILDIILFKIFDEKFNWSEIICNLWLIVRMYYFCIAITFITTDAIKVFVGDPRPCFLEIQENESDDWKLKNSRQSFISGHASLSMSSLCLLTIMFYQSWMFTQTKAYHIGNKISKTCNPHQYYLADFWYLLRDVPLVAVILVFTPVCIAVYIGLTRITDYKHFAVDVTGGMIIGACMAYIAFLVYYNETYLRFQWKLKQKNS